MGVYYEQVLPRLIHAALGSDRVGKWRKRCVEGLAGVVVEPGFGSGLNIAFYPPEVTKVYAVDPAVVGRKLSAERSSASPVEIEHVGLDGQSLPLEDASCDAGLLTFTLCTIPNPVQALAELHRVIRPGGTLHFLEHGHGPTEAVQKWQRRLEPVQRQLFDGCHLTRDMPTLISGNGFEVLEVDASYAKGPKPVAWFTVGRAVRV